MNKINDLNNELDSDLNISNNNWFDYYKSEEDSKMINDITVWKEDIDLSLNKNFKIIKLKSWNFDSFYRWKKIKSLNKIDIDSFKLRIFKVLNISYKEFLGLKSKLFSFIHFLLFKNRKYILFLLFVSFVFYWNKIVVENLVTNWYERILSIKELNWDIDKINSNIRYAKINFSLWGILFKPFSIIPNKNIDNVDHIIKWWKDISILLWDSTSLYTEIKLYIDKKNWIENIQITDLLSKIKNNYDEINSLLYSSLNHYSKVWDLWNEYLNDKLDFTKTKLREVLIYSDIINKNYDILLSLLWHESERKYLVLFQNNDEIRSTGWFIWSVWIITIKNWKVESVEKSDVYAFEWLINKEYTRKENAPEWLNRITWTFWLRDANYYPEIKDSSNKIKFFFDKIDYKIDGIVYINQNVILDLLDSVEWVESEVLGKNINSDNFSLILSTLVEAKVFKVWTLWTPKQVLFDFAWEFWVKLLEKKDYFSYVDIISKHIKSRDIIIYSFNSEENSLLWKLWLNWEINFNEKMDFNYPVYTSIWWNKTDRYIEYRYDKTVNEVKWSCEYETKLDIYNSHHFSKFEDEKVNNLLDSYWVEYKKDILNIQWRGDNKSYLRVLVPKNSTVYPSNNQRVFNFLNYKIVELYTHTRNLETSKYTIRYNIKNPNCEDYSYKFLKQPGIKKYNINLDILNKKEKFLENTSDFYYYK